MPDETRRTFTFNAPTFLDEIREEDGLMLDLNALGRFSGPTASAPFFPVVVGEVATALPHAERHVFTGAGHVPHLTHPAEYVQRVRSFVSGRRSA